jgi:hypothetical protein
VNQGIGRNMRAMNMKLVVQGALVTDTCIGCIYDSAHRTQDWGTSVGSDAGRGVLPPSKTPISLLHALGRWGTSGCEGRKIGFARSRLEPVVEGRVRAMREAMKNRSSNGKSVGKLYS